MISIERIQERYGIDSNGPLTLQDSMTESMALRAHRISEQYERYDVALLAESLGAVGMDLLDLTNQQMEHLGDIEADLEREYGINEHDEEDRL